MWKIFFHASNQLGCVKIKTYTCIVVPSGIYFPNVNAIDDPQHLWSDRMNARKKKNKNNYCARTDDNRNPDIQ